MRVLHPTSSGDVVLRVAGVRSYEPLPMEGGLLVADGGRINSQLYPVALNSVNCKLVCACKRSEYLQGRMYFMPYLNISKTY
jgi:hypothetical protein